MEKNVIPENLDDWDLDVINNLIQHIDLESETLDFKREINDIPKHICGMSNTSGGFLILGIEEIKDNEKILEYRKKGFRIGKQDEISKGIANNCFSISPIPKYEIKHIEDESVFYTVLKISNEISKKPFFIEGKGQCYIRLDNTTRPAPRSVIFNLFGPSIEYRKNIQNLQSACILLKESLCHTINYLGSISIKDQTRPALIDLTLLRNSLLSSLEFISENELLGYKAKNHTQIGIVTVIDTVEQLNSQIYTYNTTENIEIKKDIKNMISNITHVLCGDIEQTQNILDKVIFKTRDTLSKT